MGVSKQLNEFLYAIGAQDVLVARDLTSVYPPAIRQLPTVGYHRALSAEGIIAARPTMVLTDGNVGPDAVLDDVSYDALGCSISTASTSILAEECTGRRLSEVFETFTAMRSMLTSKGTDPGDEDVIGDGR